MEVEDRAGDVVWSCVSSGWKEETREPSGAKRPILRRLRIRTRAVREEPMNLPRIEDQPRGGLLADLRVSDEAEVDDEDAAGGGRCCANSAESVGEAAGVSELWSSASEPP